MMMGHGAYGMGRWDGGEDRGGSDDEDSGGNKCGDQDGDMNINDEGVETWRGMTTGTGTEMERRGRLGMRVGMGTVIRTKMVARMGTKTRIKKGTWMGMRKERGTNKRKQNIGVCSSSLTRPLMKIGIGEAFRAVCVCGEKTKKKKKE
jgi:hypothetical protein